jgi:hypothetical protein
VRERIYLIINYVGHCSRNRERDLFNPLLSHRFGFGEKVKRREKGGEEEGYLNIAMECEL